MDRVQKDRRGRVASAALAIVTLAGCSSASSVRGTTALPATTGPAAPATTAAATTSTTQPTTAAPATTQPVTTPPATTPPATTAPPPRAATTDAAAADLLAAWKTGNRAAARFSDRSALDALFARPWRPSVSDRGCTDGSQPTNACTWRYDATTVVQLTLDGTRATGFRVATVELLS